MKRHSVLITLAVAFLFVICSSIEAQSRSTRSTRSESPRVSDSSRSARTISTPRTTTSSRTTGQTTVRGSDRSFTPAVKSDSSTSRMSRDDFGMRSTGGSFATRPSVRNQESDRTVRPEYRSTDSRSESRTVIKSSSPDLGRSNRSTGDQRTIQPLRDRSYDSTSRGQTTVTPSTRNDDRSFRSTIDRRTDSSTDINKSYRSSSTPWPRDSRDSRDSSTRRGDTLDSRTDRSRAVINQPSSSSRTTGYVDRRTYASSATRVKSVETQSYDRRNDSRNRDGLSFSGSLAYSSGSSFVGIGGHYNRSHYYDRGNYFHSRNWYCPPRYRIGVEIASCHSCGYRSCRCAPTVYYCHSCGHHPCRCYSSRYYNSYYYRHYPGNFFNVNLGYFGSDWFGGFSFSTGYPSTIVTEVTTIYSERIWVPGHYAYREETIVIPDGNKEWVPAVYEEYWDGDAWVRRLISGGYWKTSPITKTETKRVWVEGYWTTR